MGVWLDLDPLDYTDRDNQPATSPLQGSTVRVYTAPWPLVELELPSGQRVWIHVRREVLEHAYREETTT